MANQPRISKPELQSRLDVLNAYAVAASVTTAKPHPPTVYGLDNAYGGYRLVKNNADGSETNISGKRFGAREIYEQMGLAIKILETI